MVELYHNCLLENGAVSSPDHTIVPTDYGIAEQVRYARSFLKTTGRYNEGGTRFVLAYDTPNACFRLYAFTVLEKIPPASKSFVPIPFLEKDPNGKKLLSVNQCAEIGIRNFIDVMVPDT